MLRAVGLLDVFQARATQQPAALASQRRKSLRNSSATARPPAHHEGRSDDEPTGTSSTSPSRLGRPVVRVGSTSALCTVNAAANYLARLAGILQLAETRSSVSWGDWNRRGDEGACRRGSISFTRSRGGRSSGVAKAAFGAASEEDGYRLAQRGALVRAGSLTHSSPSLSQRRRPVTPSSIFLAPLLLQPTPLPSPPAATPLTPASRAPSPPPRADSLPPSLLAAVLLPPVVLAVRWDPHLLPSSASLLLPSALSPNPSTLLPRALHARREGSTPPTRRPTSLAKGLQHQGIGTRLASEDRRSSLLPIRWERPRRTLRSQEHLRMQDRRGCKGTRDRRTTDSRSTDSSRRARVLWRVSLGRWGWEASRRLRWCRRRTSWACR